MQIEFVLERVHAKIDPGGFSILSLAKRYPRSMCNYADNLKIVAFGIRLELSRLICVQEVMLEIFSN